MDGRIQIHGWLASRPASFFKKKGCRLASQPSIWIHPSILGGIFIGIGRSLDRFSILWGVFSVLWVVNSIIGCIVHTMV